MSLQQKNGHFKPLFMFYSLQNIDEMGDVDHQQSVIKSTVATMYAAASDNVCSPPPLIEICD
ncbi:hypothetical protein H0H81_004073 [Sphagnurus paluster]|uniref:Uncharacterized protein n=1 Tax=Sphagnurus paluster TaxID=117069 RepID=A0A9P7GM96_9AGAR|nr:hypothetical protein H0H81_004073 [Sphagnurus paluster]